MLLDVHVVDEILATYGDVLSADAGRYRNHVYRVLNYFRGLGDPAAPIPESVLIAAAFHDLGIWTDRTFDYLGPSVRLATVYLAERRQEALLPEVTAMIQQHHKLRPYRGPMERNIELLRRADLVDVSLGSVRFNLSAAFVRQVRAALPAEGFHWLLLKLAARQLRKTPSRPLPMVHW